MPHPPSPLPYTPANEAIDLRGGSMEDLRKRLEGAVREACRAGFFGAPPGDKDFHCYISAVYDGTLVVNVYRGDVDRYVRVSWVHGDDDKVTISDPTDVQRKQEWVDAPNKAEAMAAEFVSESLKGTLGHMVLLSEAEPQGAEWDVCVIEEGTSLNGRVYSAEVLERDASLFEGAGVFAYELAPGDLNHLPEATKNQIGQGGGLLHNRIGELAAPAYGTRNGRNGIFARLKVASESMRTVLRDLWTAGQKAAVGFSIDAMAQVRQTAEGLMEVVAFAPNPTLDLVSHPAAGGSLERLVASIQTQTQHATQEAEMPNESNPTGAEGTQPTAITEADVARLAETKAAEIVAKQLDAYRRQTEARELIAASGLPEPSRKRLLESTATFEAAKVAEAIEAERAYVAQIAGPPKVEGMGGAGSTREAATGGADRLDTLQRAMDGFFEGSDVEQVPRFRTFHEAIYHVTGKRLGESCSPQWVLGQAHGYVPHFDGVGSWDSRANKVKRLGESFRKVTEAATTSTWAQILGDSVTRKMMRDYLDSDLQNWRQIVSDIVPVKDFRTQRRQMFGYYGTLSTVTEGSNYQALTTPGDDEETYSISKKGGLETITMETVANDDVGLIRRIPTRMAHAAALTLHQAVIGILTTNGNMYDGNALFDAGNHTNLLTTAFSGVAMRAVRIAMRSQIPYGAAASDTLGDSNNPKVVLFPNELEEQVWTLINSMAAITEPDATGAMPADANATTPNAVWNRSMIPICVPYWTNAKDWYVTADPKKTPTIEVGFYQGQEDPEIFVQDQANVGSTFTADKIVWKIRHIYGVKALDWRTMHFNDVA